jgi:rhodanese-related sulfurtransferase
MSNIATCNVNELSRLLAREPHTQIIDVREYSEYASEHVAGTKLVPLSALDKNFKEINPQQPAYLLCRSSARATQAANKLAANGFANLTVVEGGIMAWKAAGFPVESGSSKVWSLERQVRFTAGLIVLLGVLLSYFVHPYFIALSGFIGAGLVFSSVTDTCGMGMVLAKMPWNQSPKTCTS